MSFENPLFLTLSLSGVIFVIVGFITKQFPPKKINHLYGYRTRSSMLSEDRWVYAQRISSREMVKTGLVMVFISLFGLVVQLPPMTALIAGISILLILILIMFLRVENAIKRKFREK